MTNAKLISRTIVFFGLAILTQCGCDQPNNEFATQAQGSSQTTSSADNDEAVNKLLDAVHGPGDSAPDTADTDKPSNTETDTTTESVSNNEAELSEEEAEREFNKPTIEVGANWTRLSEKEELWIDKTAKKVMFTGRVCLNAGQLEMFICPEGTKEHESVIAARPLAQKIHYALLLVDCKPGDTASWDPKYKPAHGPTINVMLKWHDKATNKTKSMDGKKWIRDLRTEGPMTQKWIFGGSEFWKDPDTGENHYYGDGGELICLSNFSTAMIDVGVESSQSNAGLLFEAFTENIAPEGTKVYVILTPGKPVAPEK